jgi:dihydroorotase
MALATGLRPVSSARMSRNWGKIVGMIQQYEPQAYHVAIPFGIVRFRFMDSTPTLFRGARLFDGRHFLQASDLRIGPDGRIAEIGSDLSLGPGETAIDLAGRWLLPGLVDCHVHFREPGLVRKEGYLTGSAGALHGGVTTVLEIQNNPPLMESRGALEAKSANLVGVSRVDFAPYGSLTDASLGQLDGMVGLVPAVKCFLGCSTGAGGVKDEASMRRLFTAAAAVGLKIVAHCEDNDSMAAAAASATAETAERHDLMRPRESEIKSIGDAIRVATEVGAVLHVFHISTAAGGRLVAEAHESGLAVTGSTAPHYLLITAEQAHASKDHRFKVNPSIKYADDRDGLRELLAAGRLQGVGTDHAPHPLAEKARAYAQAPSGFPSIDLLLPLMVAVADQSGMPIEAALTAVTRLPADEFDLLQKGRLEVGADADLVIADPTLYARVDELKLPSKSKWSPYHGLEYRAFPQRVWLRGVEVGADQIMGQPLFKTA